MAESRIFDGSSWITITDEEHRNASDPHTHYALADGTRGSFAAPLGPDDNYVTDAEKAALHTHPAVIAQGATAADARAVIEAVPTSRTVAGKALTGNITIAAADLADFTEASQDVVGAMVAAAGGTYDDAAGAITLPAGGGGAGSGVRSVSGTVTLDDTPGLYEVYALDAATVQGVALVAGDAAVFRYLAGSWSWMIVGQHTTWQAPEPTAVTADAPTFTDADGTDDDRYVIPATTGVEYRKGGAAIAAGTYTPTAGESVTITAVALDGYTLTGTTSWTHTFSTAAQPALGPWTVVNGFTVSGEEATPSTADGSLVVRDASSLTSSTLRATVTRSSSPNVFPAVVLRYVDPQNFHYLAISSGGAGDVYKVEGGSHTKIKTWDSGAGGVASGVPFSLRFDVAGSTVSLYYGNDVQALDTVTIPDNGSMAVGFRKGGTGAVATPWTMTIEATP